MLTFWKTSGTQLPASATGQVIDYALGLGELLRHYFDDGRWRSIGNSLVGNAFRPTAVGRKNWLLINKAEHTLGSAVFLTIVEAYHRLGIKPFDYVSDVLTRLPHHIKRIVDQLTPMTWLKNRQRQAPHAA